MENNTFLERLTGKSGDLKVFLEQINPYEDLFSQASTILEIGAGQGWASCILKKKFPNICIFCSDLNEPSVNFWEEIFKIKLDNSMACNSNNIPMDNSSVDILFCFSAFHHMEYRNTIKEAYRILKPGGHCLFFHEPSCRKYIHRLAYMRVNKKRPNAGEDVIIYKDILAFAKEEGFREAKAVFRATLGNRRPLETIYYYIIGKIKIFQRILPCTMDYILKK